MDEQIKSFAKVLYYYKLVDESFYDKVKIKCPFHEDDKPSLQVNVEKDFFYCYGCGAKGDAIEFIRRIENCSSLKAIVIYNKILNNKKLSLKMENKLNALLIKRRDLVNNAENKFLQLNCNIFILYCHHFLLSFV